MTSLLPRLPAIALTASLHLALCGPAAAYEPAYESLNVATLMPAGEIYGKHYRILPEVVNRGLMNHYRIESRYGPMATNSDRELQQRIRELRALDQLADMHEGALVAESIGDTVRGTAESVVRVTRDPKGAAQGFQQGIERMLRRTGRKLRNAYDDVRNSMRSEEDDSAANHNLAGKAMQAGATFARNRFGVNRAYRELAREVGVDPYTRNPVVVAELDRLAKHAAGASLGSRLVIPRIPGLIGAVDNVSTLVWEKDRLDLLLYNEDVLEDLNIPHGLARRFTDNESYTPTEQTSIVASLRAMKDVKNLWRLLNYAAGAESTADAEFYTGLIGLLALYHLNRSPLLSVHATESFIPIAFTRDTRAVAAFPVDRFRWTPGVRRLVGALSDSRARGVKHREIWITGNISDTGRLGLAGLRWIPFNRAHQRLDRTGESGAAGQPR